MGEARWKAEEEENKVKSGGNCDGFGVRNWTRTAENRLSLFQGCVGQKARQGTIGGDRIAGAGGFLDEGTLFFRCEAEA